MAFADLMMLNSTLFQKIVEKQNFFQIQQEKLMVLDMLHEFLLPYLGIFQNYLKITYLTSKWVIFPPSP